VRHVGIFGCDTFRSCSAPERLLEERHADRGEALAIGRVGVDLRPPRQTGSLWLYAERRSFASSCVSLPRIECPIWQWGHHRDSFNDLSRQTSASEASMPVRTIRVVVGQ